jgi:hypothetical protein
MWTPGSQAAADAPDRAAPARRPGRRTDQAQPFVRRSGCSGTIHSLKEDAMSTPNDHDIKVLNGLIETTLDSADGYREAAKETGNSGFRALFEQRSFERQKVATALQGVVNSVENGEDHIKAKYEKAIEDNDLSATTRDTITRAYGSVREGHDQMRDIKHAMQAKS